MIGFNALGKLGRLGNQMFQFAALKGIARNNGYEYCIPPSKNQNEWTDHQLFECFELTNVSSLNIQYIDSSRPIIAEFGFEFDENLFDNCPDWISIQGFFQSEKYFKHIEKEIRQDFRFKKEILIPCQKMISEIQNPVSLHIRRTDYLTNSNHSVLDESYYENALYQIDEKSTIIVFSDDSEWCKNHKLFSSDRFLIAENNSNYVDLCLMTLCEEHIIANSSFSWWGAWLSEGKKVIAPKNWFIGSNNEHLDTKDLIPKEWMLME